MKAVTLYEQDRYSLLSALPAPQLRYVTECLKDALGSEAAIDPANLTVYDLEKTLDINYVDKNRDLSGIAPIPRGDGFYLLGRDEMKPLLDALEKGDFELAEALTPKRYRLCGFNEFKETVRKEQYGNTGYAGHYEWTDIPPGIYPVFVSQFAYHERDKHFTNEVHYLGTFEWFEGEQVAGSNFDGPCRNVVISSPYAYDIANNVSKGVGSRHLIYPFEPVSVARESGVDGKPYVHYGIIDASVPYNSQENPLTLRGRCSPQPTKRPSLAEKISLADAVRAHKEASTGDRCVPDAEIPDR